MFRRPRKSIDSSARVTGASNDTFLFVVVGGVSFGFLREDFSGLGGTFVWGVKGEGEWRRSRSEVRAGMGGRGSG